MGADGQFTQLERSDSGPFQPRDFVSDPRQQSADFAIAPFGQDHFQNSACALAFFENHAFDFCLAFGQKDSLFQFGKLLGSGTPHHLDKISFFHTEFRMGQAKGQFAVVCDDDQPFAALIQPPHVEDSKIGFDQVDDPRSAIGVFVSRKHTRWFIKHEILEFLAADFFAIDRDRLAMRIDFCAKHGASDSIHFDSPCLNQLFAFPAAA